MSNRRRHFRRAEDVALVEHTAALRRIAVGLLAVLCVVAVGASVALGLALVQDTAARHRSDRAVALAKKALIDQQRVNRRLADAERDTCHRLNVHRLAQDNPNAYHEWSFDRFFLAAILRPTTGVLPETAQQRANRIRAIGYLRVIVNSLTWTPATRHCSTVPVPQDPIRFEDRQPTKHDLELHGDE